MRGSRSRRKKGRREVVDGESRAGPVGVKPVEWWSGGGLRAKASASASASTVHALAGVVQYSIEPSHPAPQCSAVPAARRGTRRRRLGTRPPPPPTGRAKTQPRRDAASSRDLAPGPSGQWEDPSVSERALVARQAGRGRGRSERVFCFCSRSVCTRPQPTPQANPTAPSLDPEPPPPPPPLPPPLASPLPSALPPSALLILRTRRYSRLQLQCWQGLPWCRRALPVPLAAPPPGPLRYAVPSPPPISAAISTRPAPPPSTSLTPSRPRLLH